MGSWGAIILGALGVVVEVVAQFFRGELVQKNKDMLNDAQQALEDNHKADDTHNAVAHADPAELERLRNKWQ